jgi:hypothetical protein
MDTDRIESSAGVRRRPVDTRRSRAPEFYGFVAWTSTAIAFCLYVLWALVPDRYIVWVGITWYPSRYLFFRHVLLRFD